MNEKPQQSTQNIEVVILYCQHSISDEKKTSNWSSQTPGLSVRAIMMPCSSKVEVPYILKILESGTDAVEIVACPEKGCKFLVGSLRAEKRIEYIRRLLAQIGYAPERVGISRTISQSKDKLLDIAKGRADAVRSHIESPTKGEQQ